MVRHRCDLALLWAGIVLAGLGPLGPARAADPEDRFFPFQRGDWSVEANAIYGFGIKAFGGEERHDLALTSFQGGRILTGLLASGKWYSGALELTGQLWGGKEEEPDSSYLIGFIPSFRYHFNTGISLVPYLGVGCGVMMTDIGEPDLGGHFQFNQQYGAGVHWFFREHWALNVEYRFMHISNARIEEPNLGVNNHLAVLGVMYKF